MSSDETVNVRYMVNDVAEAVNFYSTHFGFQVGINSPAFADATKGNLRLLLSGPMSSAGRPMPTAQSRVRGVEPHPLHHDDLDGEIARLKGGRALPKRDRQWSRRASDPRRGSVWEPDRALPASVWLSRRKSRLLRGGCGRNTVEELCSTGSPPARSLGREHRLCVARGLDDGRVVEDRPRTLEQVHAPQLAPEHDVAEHAAATQKMRSWRSASDRSHSGISSPFH